MMNERGRQKKKIWKKWWFWLLIALLAWAPERKESKDDKVATTSTEKNTQEANKNNEYHIYSRAIVRDMLNGFRTKKLGEYSVIYADSSECTDDAIVDWYTNYVTENDFNYSFIIYTDKEGYGILESNGVIAIGVEVEKDEYGDYYSGNNSDARIITIDKDGKIVEV